MTKETPCISVLMSIYGESIEWIEEAINSILSQSFNSFELIIINDKPNRVENRILLEKYVKRDDRIRIVTNELNLGLTKSLNKGFALAKAKYIARMDADDISDSDRLQLQFDFLEDNPEIDICGTWVRTFGGKKRKAWKNPVTWENLKASLVFGNRLSHASVMIKRSSLEQVNLKYDESYIKAQDYALWSDAVFSGLKLCNIPKYLLKYREHEAQISSRTGSEQNEFVKTKRRDWINYLLGSCSEEELSLFHTICDYGSIANNQINELIGLIKKLKTVRFDNVISDHRYAKLLRRRIIYYSFKPSQIGLRYRFSLLKVLVLGWRR